MGLLDSIGNFLTNPQVEMLLPAVLGAAGGALTSPPLAGRRGAIGAALQGGAAGLTQGIQLAQQQPIQQAYANELMQRTKLLELQTKQLQNLAQNDEAWRVASEKYAMQLPEAQREEFKLLASGADPAQRMQAIKYFKDYQSLPISRQILSRMTGIPEERLMGASPELIHSLAEKAMDARVQNRRFQILDTTNGLYSETADPDNPGKSILTPIIDPRTGRQLMGRDKGASLLPVVTEGGEIKAFNRRTGAVSETGMKAPPKDDPVERQAVEYYEKLRAEKTRIQAENAKILANFAGLPNAEELAKDQLIPEPELPDDYATWRNSEAGEKWVNARRGRAPSEGSESRESGPEAPLKGRVPEEKPSPSASKESSTSEPAPIVDIPGKGKATLAGKDPKTGRPLYRTADGELYRPVE